VVKWLGVAYLIYLGVVTWRAAPRVFEETGDRPHLSEGGKRGQPPREIFLRGFLVNITNPKGIIFFAAIFPQFIDVARPQLVQYAILGRDDARDGPRDHGGLYRARGEGIPRDGGNRPHLRWVNRGLGGMFVAAGVALAGFRRAATL
jgi:homoserine/homoserine lactone efflux protein